MYVFNSKPNISTNIGVDDDIDTLYYKFQDHGYYDTTITWYKNVQPLIGDILKAKIEQSIQKWNNVYYYK